MKPEIFETDDALHKALKKLSILWNSRAAVNKDLPNYWGLNFNPEKKDFNASLLPFRNHPAWLEAPEDLRDKCLSYAWGIYNLKTICIECDVVTPACEDIIKSPPQSANRALLQDVMSQALLDEALHPHVHHGMQLHLRDAKALPIGIHRIQLGSLARWRIGSVRCRVGTSAREICHCMRKRDFDYRLSQNNGRGQYYPGHLP